MIRCGILPKWAYNEMDEYERFKDGKGVFDR